MIIDLACRCRGRPHTPYPHEYHQSCNCFLNLRLNDCVILTVEYSPVAFTGVLLSRKSFPPAVDQNVKCVNGI